MSQKLSIVIYGPANCGKSYNARALAKYFELSKIHDNWAALTEPDLYDTLILTSYAPCNRPFVKTWIGYSQAMVQAGLALR